METNKFLTANKLKIIAMAAMFFDHFVSVFLPHNALLSLIFRLFGRTAAPVFCFFIAEGFHYTSNLKKYITRLLIFAVISHLPYNLAFGLTSLDTVDSFVRTFFRATSVILPLAMGLIALAAIKNEKIHIILKLIILAACCAVSYRANWNYIAVLWVVAFGLFHGNFMRQIIAFCIIGVFYLFIQPFRIYGFSHDMYPQWFQLGIFLAIPLLAMYNGKVGKKSLIMKWMFYIFYPAHLILLFLLDRFTPLGDVLRSLFNI